MKKSIYLLAAYAALALAATPAFADYFYDQGFSDADYRTDFNSQTEGSSGNPLVYDDPNAPDYPQNPDLPPVANSCLFEYRSCGNAPTEGTNYKYASGSSVWNSGANFWVLSINNEPAFDNTYGGTGFDGLPNQVHELFSNTHVNWTQRPASFATVTDTPIGENYPRAHLIVRHMGDPTTGYPHSNDLTGDTGLPFISIGAQKDRGNGTSYIGKTNTPGRPDTVKFKAKIWDFLEPDPAPTAVARWNADHPNGGVFPDDPYPDGGIWFFVYVIFESGDDQWGLFINLKHIGDNTDWSENYFDGGSNAWNWPIEESFFYPGVDFAYIDSEDFYKYANPVPPEYCLISPIYAPQMTSTGVDYQFTLDFGELLRCADERGLFENSPPSNQLSIKGVHWGVEMNGINGYIWASVHDMQM